MKKVVCTWLLLIRSAIVCYAQYDRVSVSLSVLGLNANEDFWGEYYNKYDTDVVLGGFGIDYIHGFPIVKNLFLETGGSLNFQTGGSDGERVYNADREWLKIKEQYRNFNLQIPVDFAYHIRISDNVSFVLFLGLNLRLNMIYRMKMSLNSSLPALRDNTGWINLLSSSEENMGSSSLTWNWFQVGLTCGFGFNINRIYVGLNGIVDFIPAFGYSEGDYKPKINSENVKLSVGYNF